MARRQQIIGALVIAILVGAGMPDGVNPQSKKITEAYYPEVDVEMTTPGVLKKKGFVTYNEMHAFLSELRVNHADWMQIDTLGYTQNGAPIARVSIADPNYSGEETRIWMQGGLHGNEPASTEGMMFFIQQLLENDSLQDLRDGIRFCIVPMANVDGYEKQDRYSANGLDLNRDHTKLATPEMTALKEAFRDFQPHVALDFHEYRPYRKQYAKLSTYGVAGYYDVMFLYSSNLNVPQSLREYTVQNFVNPAKNAVRQAGFTTHDYFSSDDHHGEIWLKMGSLNARSSATAYALNNCVSTLIEVRGVGIEKTSFKRRSYITYLVACSYVRSAHQPDLKNALLLSENAVDSAVVVSEKIPVKEAVTFVDLDTRKLIDLPMTIEKATSAVPVLQRAPAKAYAILEPDPTWIEKLETLGITFKRIARDTAVWAERYQINSYSQDAYPYEGVQPQRVTTETERSMSNLTAGTLWIPMNQPKSRLIVELLEPERPNSWVYFDLIQTAHEAPLPVLRILQTNS